MALQIELLLTFFFFAVQKRFLNDFVMALVWNGKEIDFFFTFSFSGSLFDIEIFVNDLMIKSVEKSIENKFGFE